MDAGNILDEFNKKVGVSFVIVSVEFETSDRCVEMMVETA